MSYQYTYDATRIQKKKIIKEPSISKEKILHGIEKGMKQVKRIEKGKLNSVSLKQLLDAL